MTKIPLWTLAVTLLASPVHAIDDQRLKSTLYTLDQVVLVQGRIGFQSMIEFGASERIENVAVGNSAAWQVTPNKRANLLFLKPLAGVARTNMTVVTDQHVYLFDLRVAPAGTAPLYNLRFTYTVPKESKPLAEPTRIAEAPASLPSHPNFLWTGKGEKSLLPVRSFDDGQSLFLQWATGTPLPALFVRGPDGNEGPVNYTHSGSFIVVGELPTVLVLRLGKYTATLTNGRPEMPRVDLGSAR